MSSIIPSDLAQALSCGDAVLFIGAGLSVGAGLPTWEALMRPIAQRANARWPVDHTALMADHLLTAAQNYESKFGRQSLIQYLRDKLDTTDTKPTIIHELVASLPVRVIFTSNYDNLIETTLRDRGWRVGIVVSTAELAFWSEERIQIIKLCGDLGRPETMVITKRDFNTYFSERPRLAERLRSTLESRTALFLGYSLQEPFFNQIWDTISVDFARMRRRGYAVLFDADESEITDLHERGIETIDLETNGNDKTDLLAQWLTLLFKDLSAINKQFRPPIPALRKQEVVERLKRIEEKIDQSQLDDRQDAAKLLGVLDNARVERAELAKAVAELRAWAVGVQQAELPLDQSMKPMIDQLAEHTGSAYQYLQLAIPILPGILSYNVELGSQHQAQLQAIWGRVKSLLTGNT